MLKLSGTAVQNLVALLTSRPPICALLCYLMYGQIICYVTVSTRAVRKVSVHFEYLENLSRGLDVTWQPVRGDRDSPSPVGLVSRQ
jgi:hypothetical protein